MDFQPSARSLEFQERLLAFMDEQVYPAEEVYERELRESGDPHHQPRIMEELKTRARERGLWNMFLPDPEHGAGLSNADYAPLAEILGRSHIASEACNCSAPDTGNMEVLHQFASEEQRERWLRPLLDGEMRSAFAMTEPDVASSDATNIGLRIERAGMRAGAGASASPRARGGTGEDEYVLNGRKWWISGALHPHCGMVRGTASRAWCWCRWTRRACGSCGGCRCSATRTRRGTRKSCSRMCGCRRAT
jgi:acyl-CoA dehydrogenase